MRKIISNGYTFTKQDEITKAIAKFYKDLYAKQENLKTVDVTNKLFKDLPQISETDKQKMDKPITLNELKMTLKTCKESAPGPDGLSYNTLSHLWEVVGPLILNSWDHSCKIG